MKKQILYLVLAVFAVVFIACSKKGSDDTPEVSSISQQTISEGNASSSVIVEPSQGKGETETETETEIGTVDKEKMGTEAGTGTEAENAAVTRTKDSIKTDSSFIDSTNQTVSETKISVFRIPGLSVPVLGEKPITQIETDQYTGLIVWSPPVSASFAASTAYTATITLRAKEGYTLQGVKKESFTVEGARVLPTSDDTIQATFPETDVAIISQLVIPGVVVPVRGEVPVIQAIQTEQYIGIISWSPSDSPYDLSTVYTATIALTPKRGSTLQGVKKGSFIVPGAEATMNDENSGEITAVFPITDNGRHISQILGVLKYVPAGKFQRDKKSENVSTVSAFRMSQYQITRLQFVEIMGSDPSDVSFSSGMNDPVQMVNWYQAIAFCNKLSIVEGLEQVYKVAGVNFKTLEFSNIPTSIDATWASATIDWNAKGYRLPTEMEWMWAAMGAPKDGQNGKINTTDYLKLFAGSTGRNDISNYAWYRNNSNNKTHPVGSKNANELELYDMSGNVLDWCWDWYDVYASGTKNQYTGPSSGSTRVLRGGSWSYDGPYCTIDSRYKNHPHEQNENSGFRVVLSYF